MWTMKWSGEHPHCFCVIYLAELCLSEPHKKTLNSFLAHVWLMPT